MTQVGLKARTIREERGETQETVARRADITTATYSRIENGRNAPSLKTLLRIANALDVSLDELVGEHVA